MATLLFRCSSLFKLSANQSLELLCCTCVRDVGRTLLEPQKGLSKSASTQDPAISGTGTTVKHREDWAVRRQPGYAWITGLVKGKKSQDCGLEGNWNPLDSAVHVFQS